MRRLALLAFLVIAACGPRPPEPEPAPPQPEPAPPPQALTLVPADFADMAGWAEADLTAALASYRRSCAVWAGRDPGAPVAPRAPRWGAVGEWLQTCAALPPEGSGAQAARDFFTAYFTPFRASAPEADTGLLTSYYEPELPVSAAKTAEFSAPLHGRPADLIRVDLGIFDPDLTGKQIVGKIDGGALVPYDPRSQIGESRAPVLAWAKPVDAFFLQVQGSGRLRFSDGQRARAAFAAHNGLTYRSIGQVLIQRGELTADTASKANIEAWTQAAGPAAAQALFNENPRYVFFALEPIADETAGPRGAMGAPLTAMASMAVDPAFHAYGAPVWVEATLPGAGGDWRGQEAGLLLIAQDTGGAIIGPLRGDLFAGTGDAAGALAGSTRSQARWTVLAPHAVAERLRGPQS